MVGEISAPPESPLFETLRPIVAGQISQRIEERHEHCRYDLVVTK